MSTQTSINSNNRFGHNDSKKPTVYFLKGQDDRPLSSSQQKEISQFVEKDPFGQSFLVYNSNETLRKLSQWKKQLPWIQPFYAFKANPSPPIIKDLTSNGAGLDVASAGEIRQALELGVPASSMIYSNPVKEEKDIFYAAQQGLEYTTADTFEEIEKIKSIAPNMKILWRISIPEENTSLIQIVFSHKFGDDIISPEDTEEKFKFIAEKLQTKIYGIHFHCGSGKKGSTSFLKAVGIARQCIEIGRKIGHPMEILDLGGGYPSGDLNETFISALQQTANDPLRYKVIAEPGRHFSANSCYLLTRVLTKRIKHQKPCFHINESLFHSFNCILTEGVTFENDFKQFYGSVNGEQFEESQLQKGSLFGMTCDGADVIVKDFAMPSTMKVGDWLCFGGMGSYTIGPKSSFNGMESTTRIFEWDSQIIGEQHNELSPLSIPESDGAEEFQELIFSNFQNLIPQVA